MVTIRAQKPGGEVSIGSGFLALGEGIAVTAWHVVRGATRVQVRFADKSQFDAVGVVDRDEARDLALLKVPASNRLQLTIAGVPAQIGSHVYAVGTPEGLDFSISDGLVSQFRMTESGVRLLQFSAPVSPGSSGGPLIDSVGQVVGIVDSQLIEGQNLNFAVPTTYLRALDPTQIAQMFATDRATTLGLPVAIPTNWKSITSGLKKLIRLDGDYLYVETPLPEGRAPGDMMVAELKRSGNAYVGTQTFRFTCSWNGLTQGTHTCIFKDPLEITSLSPTRIEGSATSPPDDAKFDCRKCSFSKPKEKEPFVWIPQ